MAEPATDALSITGMVGGIVTVLGACGAGIRWIFGRADRREAVIEKKEAALVAKLEARVNELERRDEQRARENVALRLAFEIVAGVVRRDDPANPELARAERILASAFPVDLDTPADMIAALSKLA